MDKQTKKDTLATAGAAALGSVTGTVAGNAAYDALNEVPAEDVEQDDDTITIGGGGNTSEDGEEVDVISWDLDEPIEVVYGGPMPEDDIIAVDITFDMYGGPNDVYIDGGENEDSDLLDPL